MRLSCAIDSPAPVPLQNLLPVVRGAGFTAVELDGAHLESGLPGARDPAAALRSLLEESGLAVSAVMLSPMAAEDDSALWHEIARIRREMRLAQEVGAPTVHVRTGDRRRQSVSTLVLGLDALARTGDDMDLTVNVGNAPGTRIEQIEDNHLVSADLEHQRLRFLLDAGAYHAAAVNPRDALRALIARLGSIRLGDRMGRRPVPPGQGEMNVPAFLDDAFHRGYNGWIALEPPPRGQSFAKYITSSMEYLRPILGQRD